LQPDTTPGSLRPHLTQTNPTAIESPHLAHRLSLAGLSDIGRVRRRNEDSLSLIPTLGVAVVADGMGGHPGGDVASQIATDTAARLLAEAVEGAEMGDDGSGFLRSIRPAMEACILAAHADIRARGRAEPALDGMGTTLTAMALHSESGCFVLGHVGDSRAYQFRDGTLTQLTRDDTWIQQQIERGDVLPQNAKRSPYAHLLTQCLGLEAAPTPQLIDGRGRPGDTFLLCTDGLVGMLDDGLMTRLLSHSLAREAGDQNRQTEALEALLQAANEAGGQDNITAVLAGIGRDAPDGPRPTPGA
jgi:protein phosphatase